MEMRRVLALAVAALLAGCSSTGGRASPAPSSSSTVTTTTSAAPDKLGPKYSARLEKARNAPCDGESMFSSECATYMGGAMGLGGQVAEDADRLGGKYGKVATEARSWADAAEEWGFTCMTSEPGTSARISCLKVLHAATSGAESTLVAIYDIEKP